ncbi:ribokinase [Anaerococcus sp. HMSC075B03]|uniref:ribokinase n=1 Tax=Anaerococcus TaxID=165779 RepID=UPI0008A639D6|nr:MULTISPECIES: ribokinase [Anaerococcus]MBS6920708.1 ribokinase [Anaerococcus vaginalis]MDU1762543.1 ribokinase [Anaerococcus vaginalis]OFJ67572.1 ribokinase [Anaerococcus sp. HMSC065G05]OFO41208.1 ribokinase [Anaerococcus sp. HMSC075B03]
MKILNFGSLNIDIFFRVENIVKPGETISAKSIEKRPGGKGLNQSVALSKSFENVYHAGSVGDDGIFLIDYLKSENINTKYIKKSDKLTGNAIIQVDDRGENSIVLYKGANFDNDKKFIDEVLDNFDKDDILLLQNEISSMKYLIDKAYEKGMKIVLNPSPITDEIKEFDFNKIDLLLVNEIEAKNIANKDNIDESINYFMATYPNINLIVTLGSKGSIFVNKNEKIKQEGIKVESVDSTGAGDTFTGFFVSYFYQGKNVRDCLKFASLASALSVTKSGASISIPSLCDVKEFERKNV